MLVSKINFDYLCQRVKTLMNSGGGDRAINIEWLYLAVGKKKTKYFLECFSGVSELLLYKWTGMTLQHIKNLLAGFNNLLISESYYSN